MITDSAALVLFAMRSFIKLGQQMRHAYVDSTKRRELVLPLPNFFSTPDIVSAANYFAGPGQRHVLQAPRLAELLQKRRTPGQDLTTDEEAEVCTHHVEFFNLDRAERGELGVATDGTGLDAGAFNALITIRQWQRGMDPNPSALQRLAGTFIEVSIDYFTNVPGVLNQDSRQGKVVAGFLEAMETVRFSEVPLRDLPGRLFVAALDTVAEHQALLSADPKVQELIRVTTTALSSDVSRRIQALRADSGSDLVKEGRVADWAELVFRSLLSSAGGLVLSSPKAYLGVEDGGQAELVSRVGQSVLSLVLEGPDDLRLDRLFSREGLEKIIQSALAVVGEHPEMLLKTDNAGLQQLLSEIATELSKYDTLLTPDMLPELICLVLAKTGENLSLLWPDLAQQPEQHLLLTGVSTTLDILTREPANHQAWTLRFSRTDLITVAETVLDELVANPTWLLDKAGKANDHLLVALEAAVAVLRQRADQRLGTGAAVEVLRAVVHAVGTRKEFLDLMPAGHVFAGRPILAAALDTILGVAFDEGLDERAAWQIVRTEAIEAIVHTSLSQLARAHLRPESVTVLASLLQDSCEALAAGAPWDLLSFEEKLQQALAA